MCCQLIVGDWHLLSHFYESFVFSGLLGGHSAALEVQEVHGRMKWYNGSLLHLAKQLGDKLLPAFNTTSGMPMSRVSVNVATVDSCSSTFLLISS